MNFIPTLTGAANGITPANLAKWATLPLYDAESFGSYVPTNLPRRKNLGLPCGFGWTGIVKLVIRLWIRSSGIRRVRLGAGMRGSKFTRRTLEHSEPERPPHIDGTFPVF